jgi:hypothetical protein
MPELIGLANTGNKKFKVEKFFYSTSAAIKIMRKMGAATTASVKGSLTIWKDDNGIYRGERHYHMFTENEIKCNTQKELKKWIARHLKRIHD